MLFRVIQALQHSQAIEIDYHCRTRTGDRIIKPSFDVSSGTGQYQLDQQWRNSLH